MLPVSDIQCLYHKRKQCAVAAGRKMCHSACLEVNRFICAMTFHVIICTSYFAGQKCETLFYIDLYNVHLYNICFMCHVLFFGCECEL